MAFNLVSGFKEHGLFASLCSACGNSVDSFTVIHNAVQTAVACNALGVLICDWSLPGHVNPLSVSIPALLAGAGLAWKSSAKLVSRNLICILLFCLFVNFFFIFCTSTTTSIPIKYYYYKYTKYSSYYT